MNPPALQAQSLSKRYGGRPANEDVSLTLQAGSIHALVGENGAGKSTLCKMLFGLVKPDAGQVLCQGSPVVLAGPSDAMARGISMVHQHFMLVEGLTVSENVMLGAELTRGGRLDRAQADAQVQALATRFGLDVDPHARVEDLPVGVAQRVEILKALHRGADVLLLDEPTAVLTPQEVEALLEVLRRLRQQGRAILVVTHKLPEVMAVADTITVMRGGKVVAQRATAETSIQELSSLMVGRAVDLSRRARTSAVGDVRLSLEGVRVHGSDGRARLDGVSLQVRAGEVVGVAGVEGNGQTELLGVICGVTRAATGRVALGGVDVTAWNVRARRDAGLAHVPEDRLLQGLVPAWPVADNAVLGWHHRPPFTRRGMLQRDAERQRAEELVRDYDVRPVDVDVAVGSLSGGNQQKILVGRELAALPRVLLLAQPTRGVDVGAMERIHQAILQARDAGLAVLLISAELTELLALSDVIHVLYRGRLVHSVAAEKTDAPALGPHMLGAGAAP